MNKRFARKYGEELKASLLEGKKKAGARKKLHMAVKSGRIKKLPCSECGDPKSQGHHDDYDKPLEVKWYCRKHHEEAHKG